MSTTRTTAESERYIKSNTEQAASKADKTAATEAVETTKAEAEGRQVVAEGDREAQDERQEATEAEQKAHEEEEEEEEEEARREAERKEEADRKVAEAKAEAERYESERIAEEERREAERIAEKEEIEAELSAEGERIQRAFDRSRRIAAISAHLIKSTRPDLKIILKAGKNGDEKKEDYELWYHSEVMAEQSQYIDNAIVKFTEEKIPSPWEIRLDEPSFEAWEVMMRFLDPVHSRHMTAEQAVQVSEYYDRYGFAVGRELCDAVLTEYFLKQDEYGLDAQLVVDAVAVAYRAHLPTAYATGSPLVKRALVGLQEKLAKTQQELAEEKQKYARDMASLNSSVKTSSKRSFPGARLFLKKQLSP